VCISVNVFLAKFAPSNVGHGIVGHGIAKIWACAGIAIGGLKTANPTVIAIKRDETLRIFASNR
jgi:hypothetical protein